MAASRQKQLVVNADDLGLAESVNRGIIETMESGIVTSASLLVNMGAHDDAIRRLRDARERSRLDVSIGLHLNLVAGAPLSNCPSLMNRRAGRFLPLTVLAARAFTGRIDARDVERELEAQLLRAQDLLSPLDLRVTHIDSHRHAHCLPGILELTVRQASSRDIGHVRHPDEALPTLLRRLPAVIAMQVLRTVLRNHEALDDVCFAGVALMRSRTLDRDLIRLIAALPEGTTELMVHPGYDSPELAALDPYRTPREREVRALTSPTLRPHLRELGVELTHFGALATTPPA
jgi:predicted glycoside hydrolase/deacetylase ChbG (UPF0249 family)